MFLDFFLFLRQSQLKVSLKEYLTLLEALDRRVIEQKVEQFYFLCRTILIKNEEELDQFDQLFGLYFQGVEQISNEELYEIPEEWMRKIGDRQFSKEEMDQIEAMGGLDKLLERIKELFKEQKERHQGGNKWIGTGGTSPFGAYGYNPEGIRIGQHESRHRRAIKVWDKRQFKDLRDDVELETRNMKMMLKRLRQHTREGEKDQLDLDQTIRKTSKNAGLLDLQMRAEKRNNIKILLLFDIGGSMDDHIELCSQLFSAMRYEMKHLSFFYFHNFIYERVWEDNKRRWNETIPTYDIIHKFSSDYKVIFVGDASMSPYEIYSQYGSVEHYNDEPGIVWMERFQEHFKDIVWINPVPKNQWRYTQSIEMIQQIVKNRMYPLTLEGLEQAIEKLV